MKVTVCFDQVRVIVPCGDGELSVEELITRAVARYKNATKKPNDAEVHVSWLETSEDNAILDKDDLVSDVCDDKDKLIAIYHATHNHRSSNNGDGTSASSIGTNSPDSFQRNQPESKLFYGTHSLPSNGHKTETNYPRIGTSSLPITTRQPRPSDLSLVGGDLQPRALKARTNTRQREDIPAFEESSNSSTPVSSPGHDTAVPFDRNVNRKSISSGHPMLWNWIDSQEKYAGMNEQSDQITGNYYEQRGDAPGSTISPNPDSTYEDVSSEEIEITNNSGSENIGLTVSGYKAANGREIGLIINDIVPGSTADKCLLNVADRITEVNGISLRNKSNSEAEAIFKQAIASPIVTLKRSRSHSFVSDAESCDGGRQPNGHVRNSDLNSTKGKSYTHDQQEIVVEGEAPAKSEVSRAQKSVRISIELKKGPEGLGFSLTSRDVTTTGGANRVYVKNILSKGAAIEDGNLKTGDQLVEINNVDVSQKSQSEIVQMLRATSGLTKLVVVRQEVEVVAPDVTEERAPVEEEDGDKTDVFSLSIPLTESGSAGLGVSVKGKTTSGEEPEDLGIYVKSVLKGGAAAKDGRLEADDQLLRINDVNLIGMTNRDAMTTLRNAMQTSMQVGVIHIVMSRKSKHARSTSQASSNSSTTTTTTSTTQRTQNDQAMLLRSPSDQGPPSDTNRQPPLTRKSSEQRILTPNRSATTSPHSDSSSSPSRTQRDIVRNKSYFRAVDVSPASPDKGSVVVKTFSSEVHRPLRPQFETNLDKTKHVVSVSEMPSVQQSKTIVIDRPFGVDQQTQQKKNRGDITIVKSVIEDVRVTNKLQSPTSSSGRHRSVASTSSFAPPSYEETLKRQYSGVSKPISSQINGKELKIRSAPRRNSPPKIVMNENMLSPVSDNVRTMSVSSQMSIDSMLLGPNTMPFQRDAFGRLSMSERKGRAHLDATKTDFFNKIKKYKSMEELSKVTTTTDDHDRTRLSPTFVPALTLDDILKKDSLRRSESADTALSRLSLCSPEEISPLKKEFPRGTALTSSTPNYIQHSVNLTKGRNTGLNSSFRSALEKADLRNGKLKMTTGEPTIPITMRSNAQYDKPKKKGGFFKGIGNILKKNKNKREPARDERVWAKTPPPVRAIREEPGDGQKSNRRPKSLHEDALRHEFTVKPPPRKHSAAREDQLKALQEELEKCRTIQANGSAGSDHQASNANHNNNNNNKMPHYTNASNGTNSRVQVTVSQTTTERLRKFSRPIESQAPSEFRRTPSSHSSTEARRPPDHQFNYRPGSLPRQHNGTAKDSNRVHQQGGRKANSDSRIGDSSTFPRKAKVKVVEVKTPVRRDNHDQSHRQADTLSNIADKKGITISHTAQVINQPDCRLQAMV